MASMKVAMITPWRVRCGIASYSANLAEGLAQHGVDVYVVRLPRFGAMTPEILQMVAEKVPRDVDLIHVQHEYGRFQGLEGGFYAALKQHGKPIVTTMHTTGVALDVDRVIAGSSDKVIVHNRYCFDRFPYKEKVIIIPHGCKPTACPPKEECRREFGIPEGVPVVGYLGFISPNKGLEDLIAAMLKVEAALVIAGGWFVEQETTYIAQLKQWSLDALKGRCMWLGYVPDDRLAVAYGAMDVVAYPARAMSESGALLLAISHGKAVVARELPPTIEKQHLWGALLTFKDIEDLARKLKMLLGDEELRRRMEANARRYAEEHSWPKIAQRHIEVYREVLEGRQGGRA